MWEQPPHNNCIRNPPWTDSNPRLPDRPEKIPAHQPDRSNRNMSTVRSRAMSYSKLLALRQHPLRQHAP